MTTALLYLLGTLGTWAGFVLLALAVWNLFKIDGVNRSIDVGSSLKSLAVKALIGAVLLFLGARLTQATGLQIPIVWPLLPFAAWVSVACILAAANKGLALFVALNDDERRSATTGLAVYLAISVIGFVVFKMSGDSANLLRGKIDLSFPVFGSIVALLIGGCAVTAWAGQNVAVRTRARAAALHITLLAGTVVFGLPFAWLLVTSFKEERDMSSPNGIVWIPKVQLEVPYMDPKEPTVEAKYDGQRVEASIIKKNADQSADLDIIRPYSLRGRSLTAKAGEYTEIPKLIPLVTWSDAGTTLIGKVIEELPDGRRRISVTSPTERTGEESVKLPGEVEPFRKVGLRTRNWPEALEYLPAETNHGLVYLKNTLLIVVFSVIGTLLSSTLVAYAFARIRFPGREFLFNILLATMMLPGAVTLLPQFLIFRSLGWINTLLPIIVPSFFGSAFNVFLLRQFLKQVPGELEDAAKIDGCNHPKILSRIMVPAIKPALAVIAIWTFMGAWNNFMGPLIYLSTPENMPLSYALQLFQGERQGEPGLLMAFATMTMLPVLALFFAAQKYFVEGVTLSGLGGR